MVLNIGDKAPDFELVDTELKFRKLDEFKGKKIVISFFVAASSPVCEVELCTFRDKWNEISELGAQVIQLVMMVHLQTRHLPKKITRIFQSWGTMKVKPYETMMCSYQIYCM